MNDVSPMDRQDGDGRQMEEDARAAAAPGAAGSLRIFAPATTANLGAGFDCLGMALDHWNQFDMIFSAPMAQTSSGVQIQESTSSPTRVASDDIRILRLRHVTCRGEGEGRLPTDENNLFYRAFVRGLDGDRRVRAYNSTGPGSEADPATCWTVDVNIFNEVPLGSGLGSSATAIVAGLTAANALRETPLTSAQLLDLATDMEGHPDNVGAALLGGLAVCATKGDGSVEALHIAPPDGLWITVAVPDFYVGTKDARMTLPARVPWSSAVFNLSRAALWVAAAAADRLDVLATATEDAMHQPIRSALIPGVEDVFTAAREAGAVGVALSGSGPSVAAFSRYDETPAIGEAMRRAFKRVGVTPQIITAQPSSQGAHIKTDDTFIKTWATNVSDTPVAGGL